MLLKPNDRQYLVNFDPRCMVGRIYGTTSCGSHGFREDFLYMSMDGRIYVGDHKTYIIKLWLAASEKKIFKFSGANLLINTKI